MKIDLFGQEFVEIAGDGSDIGALVLFEEFEVRVDLLVEGGEAIFDDAVVEGLRWCGVGMGRSGRLLERQLQLGRVGLLSGFEGRDGKHVFFLSFL